MACLIWGTEAAQLRSDENDYFEYDSPRAGGRYRVMGTAMPAVQNLADFEKVKATEWMRAKRLAGDEIPLISTSDLSAIRATSLPRMEARRDRALSLLADRAGNSGAEIRFHGSQDDTTRANHTSLLIATASQEQNEALAFLEFLIEAGLIKKPTNYAYKLTFEGWRRIEQLQGAAVDSAQAFVAMWFDNSMEEAFERGIRPAIEETGYRSVRIDRKEHINKIDDEIVAEIRRSRFVVADFTSEPDRPRGGVYFEAGFALGLNRPVIWTCRQDLIGQVHFDTRQFNHITWTEPAELRTKLRNRIGAVLGQGPIAVRQPDDQG